MKRPVAVLLVLCAAAAAALCLLPTIGMQPVSILSAFSRTEGDTAHQIFWQLRVPRVLLAFLAGAALAVSGMAFQSMFRNPLATPFTLGVSSGASLGAAIYFRLGAGLSILGLSGVSFFAFGGALAAICLVYGLTRAARGFSTATLLLAGIAVSMFFSSLILFLQYLSDFSQSFRIVHWLMGGFDAVGFQVPRDLLPFVAVGTAIVALLTRELNLLATGDDIAASRGVAVKRVQKMLFFCTSLMIGGVVAFCGPIGFVGMMAPHICRLLVGPNHRYLLPASFLFGGAFLALCDTIGRTLIAPAQIPVGVITALVGGPFFIWLLLRNRGSM